MAVSEEYRNTQKFPGKPGDFFWGKYDYYVTPTQRNALDAIMYLLSTLPRAYSPEEARDPRGYVLPEGGFYSQNPKTGTVVIGLNHCSVNVQRDGRLTGNQKR